MMASENRKLFHHATLQQDVQILVDQQINQNINKIFKITSPYLPPPKKNKHNI